MNRFWSNILLAFVSIVLCSACDKIDTTSGKGELPTAGVLTNGAFTVAKGKQVYFSQANLQYNASSNIWRFAEHQYDIIGEDNANISKSYNGWIDLFGWGTSGYKNVYPYGNKDGYSIEKDIAGTKSDWGVYNKISNGGNKANLWRTLTSKEWDYLLTGRPQCDELYARGCIESSFGLILLPDNWVQPENLEFFPQTSGWYGNYYTLDEWTQMEANGAVFLPTCGSRLGSTVDHVNITGNYWTSSIGDSFNSYCLDFGCGNVNTALAASVYGYGVRLVCDL